MQLFMVIFKCKEDGASNICVVSPYLAYTRQDKVFVDGEIITISLVTKILSSLGTTKLITVDSHSPDVLNCSIATIDLTAIPSLSAYVKKNMKINNPIVVSPDEGGIERAKKFARLINANILSLVKTRDRFTGDVSISLSEQLPLKKRTALIVDDMISTGTSVIKAIELLKKNNIGDVYVICTHALLLDDAK
jgi:ribose-phosphate pyrophosphokinase